jgi:GxxExxY protein
MPERINDELTEKVIGLCFEVHNKLGPGFPEKVYHKALIILLEKNGIRYETEKWFNVKFEGVSVGNFRCDLFIENELILELKAVEGFMPKVFVNTLVAYLKASNNTRGLLVNFGAQSCVIKRVSNTTPIE